MRVAIVTAFNQASLELDRLCASVAAQTSPVTHILVGEASEADQLTAKYGAQQVKLCDFHDDFGTTARSIGGMSAFNRGFDAIAYLDPPHWIDSDHIARAIHAVGATGAHVVFSERKIILPNSLPLEGGDPEDASRSWVDGNRHFLTNKAAASVLDWAMLDRPIAGHASAGVVALLALHKTLAAWTGRPTLNFVGNTAHYLKLANLSGFQVALDPREDERHFGFDKERNKDRIRFDMSIDEQVLANRP
jgi:hypothetical protein